MTIKYNNVFIEDAYTICGNYENDGPLSKYFDKKYEKDLYFGEKSWEQAEVHLLKETNTNILKKNKLKEEDKNIYYCAGETVDKIDMLPQVEGIKDKHEVLYLTDYVDEFAIMAIHEYKGKTFVNVSNESTDLSTEEEKEKINKENTDNKDMLEEMKKVLEGNVEEVKLTNKLKSHPVCLTTTGEVSTSMEKVINAMPTDEKIKASEVLEINASHKIVDKLKDLYKNNKDEFTKYTKVIYYEARLIEGLPIDNPTELSNLMCDIMANK